MATTLGTSITTSGILSVNSTAGIVIGNAIQVRETPFGGLAAGTTYFVIGTTALTLSLSLSSGGSPLAIAGGSGTLVVISGVVATSVTTAGVLTVGSTTSLVVGKTVKLFGTNFGGLSANTTYYIRAIAPTTISLSLTQGGAALSLVGGTGSMVLNAGPNIGPGLGNIITTGIPSGVTDPKFGDYNTIQYIVSKVMGPPSDTDPRYGYNQLLNSSQVTVGTKITLSHWLNLRDDMVRARGHQTGSSSESNNISLPTTLSKITEATRLEFYNYALTLTTYRDYLGPGQYEPLTYNTAKRTSVWRGNINSTVAINFGSVPAARAFFNAGGVVKFSCALDGTFSVASADKDNTWSTMFATMGTVTMDRTGVTLATGSTGTTYSLGFFNLQATDQLIFRKSAPTGSYTNNAFEIYAKTGGGVLTFTIYYKDLDVGALQPTGAPRVLGQYVAGTDEYVDGFLKQETILWRPSGSYVAVPNPTVTQSGDLQDATGAVYGLWADKYVVDEGGAVTIKLRTLNVSNGVNIPWTITGIAASRFSIGSLTGFFTVSSNEASASFTLANNLFTDGPTTFTLALNNGTAVVNIDVNDTSLTPTGVVKFEAVGFSQPWLCPPGVKTVSVLIVAGGGGGGRKAGGGGGAGQVRILNTTTAPGNTYYITVGGGGLSNSLGSNSDFNGNIAFGGNPGFSGDSTGHAGTHLGGGGGQNGSSTFSGGSGAGSTGTVQRIAGGGGAGSDGNGLAGDGALNRGGRGGVGRSFSFYGQPFIYIGGGGGGGAGLVGGFSGGSVSQSTSPGGYGGGNGNSANNVGRNGVANTGGGGGGGGANSEGTQLDAVLVGYDGGTGGSGFVWIGYP